MRPCSTDVLIDMHVHTRSGSLDSSIEPASLAGAGRRAGLSGIVVAEHYRVWEPAELQRWSTDDVRLFAGAEVATDIGHVIAVGFRRYPRSRTITDLHQEALDEGATLILAHPFRAYLDSPHHWLPSQPQPIAAAIPRIIPYITAIETDNNGCTAAENSLAAELQSQAGLGSVGGSDAHVDTHVGRLSTRFSRMPENSGDLALLLRTEISAYRAPRRTRSALNLVRSKV